MTKSNYRLSKETKQQIIKRIKEEGISVAQAAEDHGVSTKTIYNMLTKGVTKPVTWSAYNKLRKENEDLKMFIGQLTVELSKAKKKN